ncbi:polysaccharide deacetylase family protein [Brevundimonas staleyi]|uniref:Chitooligosaccharide deacetylase n=1 Tax=Brevundimonas staleyi TaxID=74326 RepID=A0ABW0FV31_9CAUL
MMSRRLILGLCAALIAGPVAAQTRSVAVTFDDLPYQASTEALCNPEQAMTLTRDFLAMLEPLDSHATAFVNSGKVCEAEAQTLLPQILNAWLDAGIDLGNHTASHINIHSTTPEAYLADVDAGAPVVQAVLEARGRTLQYFRHPYLFTGETQEKHDAIAAGLSERGYVIAPVTIDNVDWMFGDVYRKAERLGDEALKRRVGEAYVAYMTTVLDFFEPYGAEITGGREPAQVLLLHANTLNRDWYPQIDALYRARGYAFVTLAQALEDPIYGHADTYVRRNGVSWLHRWTQTDGRPIRWEPEPPAWIVAANQGSTEDLAAAVAAGTTGP